jgi:hypothetical protein
LSDIYPLSKRIAYFRRVFAKGLGRKATSIQAVAITNAAVLTARAEAAANDPHTTANDLVRLSGCALRARTEMQALLAKRDDGADLDHYLEASA